MIYRFNIKWSYFIKYELKLRIQRNKIGFLWWLGIRWTVILCVWWSVIIWIATFVPVSVPFSFSLSSSDIRSIWFDIWFLISRFSKPSWICNDWLMLRDLYSSSLTSGLMFQDFVAYCAKIWCSTRKILVKHTCISLFLKQKFQRSTLLKIINNF